MLREVNLLSSVWSASGVLCGTAGCGSACKISSKERKALPSFLASFIVAISAVSAVCPAS
jgi:hypothetical protein